MKKIDLHIHTIKTQSDTEFSFSLSRLKEYIITERIDAIAITNHNCFDQKQFSEIHAELKNHTKVFPGIEINIGQNAGHMIVIGDSFELEDFSQKCMLVKELIKNPNDSITDGEFLKIFSSNLNKYLIIPHYDKKPKLDRAILLKLKNDIFCGEVGSIKKFIYCKKDRENTSLTPLYFSDWRPVEDEEFPTRQTYIDIEELSIPSLKKTLMDKSKVQLSNDEGHHVFKALPNLTLSTGLSVILGGRSSGKSYTLDKINENYENVKYIRQFSLLETDPSKEENRLRLQIEAKNSSETEKYFKEFAEVVDDVKTISIERDERELESFISTLLTFASEAERADAFSKCALYNESDYSIDDLKILEDLIASVEKILDTNKYQDIIFRNIEKEMFVKLHQDLIATIIKEKQSVLKKIWINDVMHDIKLNLQAKSAILMVTDVDFYKLQINKQKVKRFNELVNFIKTEAIINKQNIEDFTIQMKKRAFIGVRELKTFAKVNMSLVESFSNYDNPYKFLCILRDIKEIPVANYYKYFAKIDCEILNQFGYLVSGGERAEFNLLQEINNAYQHDMLLIDEPESSFDNIFLKEKVNHIIKEISESMPVIIATHNNTVGASIKPDYIVHTKRIIRENQAIFKIYYGAPSSKELVSCENERVKNIDITLDCLEAGKSAYNERRKEYEILED